MTSSTGVRRPPRSAIPTPRAAPPSVRGRAPSQTRVSPPHRKLKKFLRLLKRLTQLSLIAFLLASIAVMTAGFTYHVAPPVTSSFMDADPGPIQYQHVSIDHMSRNLLVETIGHEDQTFPDRPDGVNWGDYATRARDYLTHTDDQIGSTIPEQLAKNIWLNSDRSPVRIAEEVALTEGLVYMNTKKDMLEAYLNFAQFGPHLYGVCAASWYYFNEPPSVMSKRDAAELTSILPGPAYVTRGPAGGLQFQGKLATRIQSYVRWGDAHVNSMWSDVRGLQAVQKIGILDLASDHAQDTGPDACSRMPGMVADLIKSQGYQVPAPPAP